MQGARTLFEPLTLNYSGVGETSDTNQTLLSDYKCFHTTFVFIIVSSLSFVVSAAGGCVSGGFGILDG